MGADNHPTVMVETDDYSGLRQQLEQIDGVTCIEARTSGRPFKVKLEDDATLHRRELEAIDEAGLTVVGVSNSKYSVTYVHVVDY